MLLPRAVLSFSRIMSHIDLPVVSSKTFRWLLNLPSQDERLFESHGRGAKSAPCWCYTSCRNWSVVCDSVVSSERIKSSKNDQTWKASDKSVSLRRPLPCPFCFDSLPLGRGGSDGDHDLPHLFCVNVHDPCSRPRSPRLKGDLHATATKVVKPVVLSFRCFRRACLWCLLFRWVLLGSLPCVRFR